MAYFNRTKSVTEKIFWIIFVFSIIAMVVEFTFYGFVGMQVVNEVQEANGSVGQAIGHFIKEINKEMN